MMRVSVDRAVRMSIDSGDSKDDDWSIDSGDSMDGDYLHWGGGDSGQEQ